VTHYNSGDSIDSVKRPAVLLLVSPIIGTRVGGHSKGLRFSSSHVGRGWVAVYLRCVILLAYLLTIFGLIVFFDGGMLVND